MNLYIGVTDNQWFRFLRSQDGIEEVNFWQPGGKTNFKALAPGQPFLFKLHHPENFIVGGGFFMHFSKYPATLAWEAFGIGNGAKTFDEMRKLIAKFRRTTDDPRADYEIGCIILGDPFFFAEKDWIVPPENFKPNIVQGKTYDMAQSPAMELWEEVSAVRRNQLVGATHEGNEEVYGSPALVVPRLGQGAFRVRVSDVYHRRCAVTGERALPTLEAAHVLPVSNGGKHRVDNGLLVRSDVHTLFDRGYLTVTPDYTLKVSSRLKVDFDDGETYREFANEKIWVPDSSDERPKKEFLEWHNDTVFKG